MTEDEQEENAARVIVRILNDVEKVLTAYEMEDVPSEIVLATLIMALHDRLRDQGIPYERVLQALYSI